MTGSEEGKTGDAVAGGSHSFLDSLNTEHVDVDYGNYEIERETETAPDYKDEDEWDQDDHWDEDREDHWDEDREDHWDEDHDVEDLDLQQEYDDDPDDKFSDEEDEEEEEEGEEEGPDNEEVNFNELVLDDEARRAVRNKRGKPFKRIEYSNRLTDEFKLLMGEANLCVAKGDRKTAINICLEIIRNIPDSPAPYETLSVIFEEENDLYKSLQYGLVSAHLWPRDSHKWYGLAQKCMDLNDKENEKICMSKALRYSHLTRDKGFIEDVISYFVKPGSSEEILSEETASKLAIGYRKLIKISTDSDTTELRTMLENFETRCSDDPRKEDFWAKTYVHFIKTYPDLATVDRIIKVCKIYLSGKHYRRIPPLLEQSEYITSEAVSSTHDPDIPMHEQVQERLEELQSGRSDVATNLPLDCRYVMKRETDHCPSILRAVLVAALIYLDHDSYNTEELLNPLLSNVDPNTLREELLLVADAYFHTNNLHPALPIYDVLSKSCNTEHPHTWVQLGLCFEDQDDWRAAVRCYETVLSFEESNAAAKLRLFSLQRAHLPEHTEEFSVNIHADITTVKELSLRPDVVKLSFHRSNELILSGRYSEALEEGYNVLKTALFESIELSKSKSLMRQSMTGDFLRGSHTSSSAYNMLSHVVSQKLGHNKGECEAYREMLSREEWYDWYVGLLACCMAANKLQQGFILSLAALASRLIDTLHTIKDMQIHSLYLAGVLSYREYISENIGSLLYSNPDTPGIWNIFYSIRHRLPQYRLHRLGVRWLHKNKGAFNGLFLNMQNSYYSRHYKAAIAFFRQMLGQRPRNGRIYFYLSLFYLHYSCSKGLEFSSRRHEMAVQAIACILMYHQLRGPCQESYYNIGRCYHHLGLFHLAMQYYDKALSTAPSVPQAVQSQIDKINKSRAKQREKPGDDTTKPGGDTTKPAAPKDHSKRSADNGESPGEEVSVELYDVDLTHETVYNMSQIYEACGSEHLARQLMYKYAVV